MKTYRLQNGKLLSIAPGVPEDAEALLAFLPVIGGESDNLTFGADETFMSVEEERAFLKNAAEAVDRAFYLGKIDGEIVASGSIRAEQRKRVSHNAELGLTVCKQYWRQGIGEMMMHALIDFARETGSIRVVHLSVRAENHAGIALYEKLGFSRVGMHQAYFCIDGAYYDALLMDLHL